MSRIEEAGNNGLTRSRHVKGWRSDDDYDDDDDDDDDDDNNNNNNLNDMNYEKKHY
jgi:hypothetical protein